MSDLVLLGPALVHTADHLRVAAQEGARVVAAHDRNPAPRRQWSERLNVLPLDSPGDIAGPGTVAALVFSETAYHETDCRVALKHGLPVFVEKPLGTDAAMAHRITAAADTAGLLVDGPYFLRTNGPLAEFRRRVRAGAVDRVIKARVRFAHERGHRMRLEIDLTGTEGAVTLRDGIIRLRPRGGDRDTWTDTIRPLDAGEGVRPFLNAVRNGHRSGLMLPADAVAVNAALDRLYGR